MQQYSTWVGFDKNPTFFLIYCCTRRFQAKNTGTSCFVILGPGGKRENQGEFYFRFILSITSLYIWILTLISSQRHPKMDSEGDSEFEEKNGRKISWPKKKSLPTRERYLAKVTLIDLPSLYIREC